MKAVLSRARSLPRLYAYS